VFEGAGAKAAASVGVNTPVITVKPAADGSQEHLATNGATVVVTTASQPVTIFPFTENATEPGALAVPLMTIGPRSKTPLPPDMIKVVAAGAACAAPPLTTPPVRASAITTAPVISFFMTISLNRL
jgi:hypothetical protein